MDATKNQTVTLEETVHVETTCLILDAEGGLGEPTLTGRSFRVRTIVFPDGSREVLSVDRKHHPKGGWHRRKLTSPLDAYGRDVDEDDDGVDEGGE